MRLSLHAFLLGAVVSLAACGSSGETTAPETPETATFAPVLNVNLEAMIKTASGLFYKDSVVGTGADALRLHELSVNYTGWLTNGTKFDSSFNPGRTVFTFTPGVTSVIAGWTEGVVGMKVGGWRKLVIPSALAYGPAGSPPDIPPNAVLVFNVQLVSAK